MADTRFIVKKGTVSGNEVWKGRILIEGDLVIERSAQVSIRPGTVVRFAAGADRASIDDIKKKNIDEFNANIMYEKLGYDSCYVIVRGRLECAGSVKKRIAIGGKDWRGGIIFQGRGGKRNRGFQDKESVIENTDIRGAGMGIMVLSGASVRLSENTFSDCLYGILNINSRVAGINNVIQKCLVGIMLFDAAGSRLEHNTMRNIKHTAISCWGIKKGNPGFSAAANTIINSGLGISMVNCVDFVIESNRIIKSRVGIYVSEARRGRILRNKIERSQSSAIFNHKKVEDILCAENEITDFRNTGISNHECAGFEILGNVIRRGDIGIDNEKNNSGIIKNNTISDLSKTGLIMKGVVEVEVIGNIINRVLSGLICKDEAQIKFSNNKVYPKLKGLLCYSMATLEISNNIILFPKKPGGSAVTCGVELIGMAEAHVRGNTLKGMSEGILCNDNCHIKLESNSIETENIGVSFQKQSSGEVIGNSISGKMGKVTRGVVLAGSNNARIAENMIDKVNVGIDCSGSIQAEIRKNRIRTRGKCVECRGSSDIHAAGNLLCGIGRNNTTGIEIKEISRALLESNEINGVNMGIDCGGQTHIKVLNNLVMARINGIICHEQSEGDIESNRVELTLVPISVGIFVADIADIIVKNNVIINANTGIQTSREARADIKGNSIKVIGIGIKCSDQTRSIIALNRISGERKHDTVAIFMGGMVEARITDNEIGSISLGIVQGECTDVHLARNIIHARNKCIVCGGQTKAVIDSNKLYGMKDAVRVNGIEIYDLSNVVLKNNLLANTVIAVTCRNHSSVKMRNNTVKVCQSGIICDEQAAVEIRTDKLEGVSGRNTVGMIVRGMASVVVKESAFTGLNIGMELNEQVQAEIKQNSMTFKAAGLVFYGNSAGEISLNSMKGTGGGNTIAVKLQGISEIQASCNELVNLNIGFECKEQSKIRAIENVIRVKNNGIILEKQASGRIEKNSITGSRSRLVTGIEIKGASSATVTGNELSNTAKGILCSETAQTKIENNSIKISEVGVVCLDQVVAELGSNRIEGLLKKNVQGIYISGIAEAVINKNSLIGIDIGIECKDQSSFSLTSNEIRARNVGIACSSHVSGSIRSNKIRGLDLSGMSVGIKLTGAASVKITENRISSASIGIQGSENAVFSLESNRIKEADKALDLAGSSEVKAFGNNLEDVSIGVECREQTSISFGGGDIKVYNTAVLCYGQITGEIYDNRITGKRKGKTTGVCLSGITEVTIRGNEIISMDTGIQGRDNAVVSIVSNKIMRGRREGARGIDLGGASDASVVGNTLSEMDVGIKCEEQVRARVVSNKIGVRQRGLIAGGQVFCELSSNRITGKDDINTVGIELKGAAEIKMKENNISGIATGIKLEESTFAELDSSSVKCGWRKNSRAVYLGGVAEMILKRNKFEETDIGLECRVQSKVTAEENTICAAHACILCHDQVSGRISSNMIKGRDSADTTGIDLGGISEMEIDGNELRSVGTGIMSGWESRPKIEGNTIKARAAGIRCSGQMSGEILGNSLSGTSGRMSIGVEIGDMSEIKVSGNAMKNMSVGIICGEQAQVDINKNEIYARGKGIICWGHVSGKIESNRLRSDERSEATAVEVSDVAEISIAGNEISGTSCGIVCACESQVKIDNNSLSVEDVGVEVTDQTSGDIRNNVITGSEQGNITGIIAKGIADILVQDNRFLKNYIGIECGEQAQIKISGNDIDIRQIGILCNGQAAGEITSNRIRFDSADGREADKDYLREGVRIEEEAEIKISGNIITGGISEGMIISGSGVGDMNHNEITAGKTGIRCEMYSVGRICGNSITAENGIEFMGACEAEVVGNKICAVRTGISLDQNSLGKFRENIIEGDGSGVGIEIKGLGEVRVQDNSIKGHRVAVLRKDKTEMYLSGNRVTYCDIGILSDTDEGMKLDNNTFMCLIDRKTGDQGYSRSVRGTGKRPDKLKKAQKFVLKTKNLIGFKQAYKSIYQIGKYIAESFFQKLGGIEAIYLRRGMSGKDWMPGASDIDYFFVIEDCDMEKEIGIILSIKDEYRKLKRIFPFLGEIQMGTRKELANYMRYGDIRAWESGNNWRLLYGSDLREGDYAFNATKFKIDILADMMKSLRLINDIYYENEAYPDKDYRYVKGCVDILKAAAYLEDRSRLFGDRTEVIGHYIKKEGDAEGIFLIIKDVWSGRRQLKEDEYTKLYVYALGMVGGIAGKVRREVEGAGESPGAGLPATPSGAAYELAVISDGSELDKWVSFCEGIYKSTEGGCRGAVLESPGIFYLIIDRTRSDPGFFPGLREKKKKWDREEFIRETPQMIVTEDIFWAIQVSLFLENGFSGHRLMRRKGELIIDSGNDKTYQSNIDFYLCPVDRTTSELLVRECISLMSISFRMYEEISNTSDSYERFRYLYSRILGLSLALHKDLIVPPYIDILLKRYISEFPGTEGLIPGKIDKEKLMGCRRENNNEVFREEFRCPAKLLKDMNDMIYSG
ncbi:MAG: right-handed parallel beta-helix repeat-containing protein [Elusimicrobia bacterium]|nr:right-handed parallel beta-helix repeat-containing protein [Elusimicrobiota bacterium]